MAEAVVDRLEAVEVEAQHAHGGVGRVGAPVRQAERQGDALVEQGAVDEAGERVVVGQEADAPLRLALLADVAHRQHLGRTIAVADPARHRLDRDGAARRPQGDLPRFSHAGLGRHPGRAPARLELEQLAHLAPAQGLQPTAGQRAKGGVGIQHHAAAMDQDAFGGAVGELAPARGLRGEVVVERRSNGTQRQRHGAAHGYGGEDRIGAWACVGRGQH